MYVSAGPRQILFLTFFSAALLFSVTTNGQKTDSVEHQVTVSAQLRPRMEIRDGAFRPLNTGEKPAALISERVRLNFDYSYKSQFSVHIAPQNVGIWGQTNMQQGSGNAGNQLALFEAWTNWNISPAWSVKIGRQVVSLDDERFFGALDWAQGGRAHDALSVHLHKEKIDFKGFFSYNQNYKVLYANNLSNPSGSLYSTQDAFPYKWMQTLWAGVPLSKQTRVTALASNLGFQQAHSAAADTGVFYTQTFGGNFFHSGRHLTMNGSAFYQRGQNSGGSRVNAWLLAVFAGYNVNSKWHVGTGSDWVSGNDVGKPVVRNRAFNPFFHTGHKFYGAMDYYYAGNPHRSVGLVDHYWKVNVKPGKALSVQMDLHQFFTPNTVAAEARKYSHNLGQEMDLFLSWKINPIAQLTGGYSFYLTTSTIRFLKTVEEGKKYQQWMWASLNVTPVFLKAKY